jgi:hypothetical protein
MELPIIAVSYSCRPALAENKLVEPSQLAERYQEKQL